ncbi:MAG TPA: hypothetical protein VJX94_18745 [Stellaceae bacterium]|nr:hypothetical protein [Stellaceae bacterium]
MLLRRYRPLLKGGLRGFAAIELPIRLVIHDISVLLGKNAPWATLPATPQLGHEGQQKRDASGTALYVPVLEWRSRELTDRFSAAVAALVRSAHPDAVSGLGGAPA